MPNLNPNSVFRELKPLPVGFRKWIPGNDPPHFRRPAADRLAGWVISAVSVVEHGQFS
ncbi:MAG: hypothetical protein N2C14_28580 [Planctomycetales bacterium]